MITASGMLVNQHVVIYSFVLKTLISLSFVFICVRKQLIQTVIVLAKISACFFSKRTLLNYAKLVLANFKVQVYKEVPAAVS